MPRSASPFSGTSVSIRYSETWPILASQMRHCTARSAMSTPTRSSLPSGFRQSFTGSSSKRTGLLVAICWPRASMVCVK